MRLVEAFVWNDSSFDRSYSKDCMLTMCMTLSHDREENDSVLRVVVTCCCHSKRGNQIASVVVMTDDEQLNILNGPIVQPMMVTKGHVCSWWILWWSCFSIISHLFLFFPLSKCFFFFRVKVCCFPWLHTPTFSFCAFREKVCLIHTHTKSSTEFSFDVVVELYLISPCNKRVPLVWE